eukprot:6847172-Pyramimonas_sp.AAC.1
MLAHSTLVAQLSVKARSAIVFGHLVGSGPSAQGEALGSAAEQAAGVANARRPSLHPPSPSGVRTRPITFHWLTVYRSTVYPHVLRSDLPTCHLDLCACQTGPHRPARTSLRLVHMSPIIAHPPPKLTKVTCEPASLQAPWRFRSGLRSSGC